MHFLRLPAFTIDRKYDMKRSPSHSPPPSPPFPVFWWKIPRGRAGTLYIANIVQLWDSLLFSRKEKEMSFAAVSRRPRTLTNYCERCAMLTRGESKSQWSATGVRLDEISLRRNLISSRARVRGNAIECLARIGYQTLARGARGNVRRRPSCESDWARTCADVGSEGVRWERRYERTWSFSVERAKNEDSVREGGVIEYQSFEIPRCQQSSLENITYK